MFIISIFVPQIAIASDYIPRGYYIIDLKNRVEWLTCVVGTTWENDTCSGKPVKLKLDQVNEAIKIANEQLGGKWRLPNRVELENVINKICSNQEIEENQIKPIVNNIKSKKEKGTYTEQFGMRAFRYVVDTEITETVSEEYRNKIASSLLAKYE